MLIFDFSNFKDEEIMAQYNDYFSNFVTRFLSMMISVQVATAVHVYVPQKYKMTRFNLMWVLHLAAIAFALSAVPYVLYITWIWSEVARRSALKL